MAVSAKRVLASCLVLLTALLVTAPLYAQGVTTSSISGILRDDQGLAVPGATVVATHVPSGTAYDAVTNADGGFTIPGMRIGGPYTITAELSGFQTQTLQDVFLSLGVGTDVQITLSVATLAETVTVSGKTDPVFSSTRTGAGTAVSHEDIATLPTISGRITDITRLTPQYGGNGTFAGQDNRANNMTVDGSYFNNSFGLGVTTGGIGDRTGVAPISLEAIEQVQVSVAPYDVKQGNFVGANVNTVTKSGTNRFTASVYTRYRNESYVGTDAADQKYNPGTFKTTTTGEWSGGPIIKNRLFFFQSFENQKDNRPLTPFRSNAGGEPAVGNITRVQRSDLAALSTYLQTNFKYETGPFDDIPDITPAKPWLVKGDYNLNNNNKVTFRYTQLDSSSDTPHNGSSALGGTSRQTNTTQFLTFDNSNYEILENLKSGVGEWNAIMGTSLNSLLIGYTKQDESRGDKGQVPAFPFVSIGAGDGSVLTAFGNEPFTPFNLLRYSTFQMQDSFTKYTKNHSFTFGGNVEKFHSDNSFYFGIQSAYSYNTLADFYTDANSYLANPNRTTAAAPNRFQAKYLLQPGQTTPPMQPLDVIYSGGYVQDEWRPARNLTVTAGLRMDVPVFKNTAFDNPVANTLTFRDQDGSPVQYDSGALPEPKPYWSPRLGFNWDPKGDQATQIRGGSGIFSGKPPYVWISNQIGNTGVLYGFLDSGTAVTTYGFNPNTDRYKPAPTGGTAGSYELDVTDEGFRFPQTWRTSIGIDRKLPWGLIGTADFIYNRDRNAPVYINANLPGAQTAYTGVDNRPRWAAVGGVPACVTAIGSENGPCVSRINNSPGKNITAAYVIKNQSDNHSWNISGALSRPFTNGIQLRGGFNYGISRSRVEPSSTAGSSWGSGTPNPGDPNNPPLAYSTNSPGSRIFVQGSYTKSYFSFGTTTISLFYDGHTNGNTSYIFSGDANGDTVSGNDLIYIPRSTSEMNFRSQTVSGRTYTPAELAAAFDQLIQADAYLSKHRGEYAERNAVFLPYVNRIDLNLTQDIFHNLGRYKHSGQVRLDITNFGNLLNKNWGVGTRITNNQILTSPLVDPAGSGALTYQLQTLSGQLLSSPRQTSAGVNDVYVMMLSFRYMFN